MNPVIKYTLARFLLFAALAVATLLIPVPLDPLVKLLIAVLLSFVLSFFMFKKLREEMAEHVAGAIQRRQEQKQKLQEALAGDDRA